MFGDNNKRLCIAMMGWGPWCMCIIKLQSPPSSLVKNEQKQKKNMWEVGVYNWSLDLKIICTPLWSNNDGLVQLDPFFFVLS